MTVSKGKAGTAQQAPANISDRESIARYLDSEAANKLRTRHVRRMISALADNVRSRLDVVEGPKR